MVECYGSRRVESVKGQVDLSLRLSQVDPEAAKKLRQKLGRRKEERKKKKEKKEEEEEEEEGSAGESCEAETE